MKKLILGSMLTVASIMGAIGNYETCEETSMVNAEEVDIMENVGNGLGYTYTVTGVNDGEVYGIPETYASEGNKGILLYEEEISFTVDEGDKIIVVWGEEEDEFASIERAVQNADGVYVSENSCK